MTLQGHVVMHDNWIVKKAINIEVQGKQRYNSAGKENYKGTRVVKKDLQRVGLHLQTTYARPWKECLEEVG